MKSKLSKNCTLIDEPNPHERLTSALSQYPSLTVAVSGGVDSLTLATVAGRMMNKVSVAHAQSPAVPIEATQRVQEFANREGWELHVINAREFDDPNYILNPLNRCYFCKTNLYTRIRELCKGPLAAGTNLDDLGEFRPGLGAAREHNVVHPYVDAKIGKAELRNIARDLDLGYIARLPAQPCLASRVQTGISISPNDLVFINKVETAVAKATDTMDIRCRITPNGIVLETSREPCEDVIQLVRQLCKMEEKPFAGNRLYERGSAFVATLSK